MSKKLDNIIIVLSHGNVSETEISQIGKSRVTAAAELFADLKDEETRFLFTGGRGERVRCFEKPHAHYMADYLVSEHAINRKYIIPEHGESLHTGEDALTTKPIAEKYADSNTRVYLVTSAFHIPRVKVTFARVHDGGYKLITHSAGDLKEAEIVHALAALGIEARPGEYTLRQANQLLHRSEADKFAVYFGDDSWEKYLTQRELAVLGEATKGWNRRIEPYQR